MYSSKASLDSFCHSNGMYDLPEKDSFYVKKYYEDFCKKNENVPKWNGERGKKAKCYTATAICSKYPGCTNPECIANFDKDIKCIYEQLASMDKCIQFNKATPTDVLAENQCFYGGIELSEYSSLYSYDPENFCVRETVGTNTRYIGYRCQNKDNKLTGGLMASAVKDVGCSLDSVTLTTTPVPPTSPLLPNEPTDIPVAPTATVVQPLKCSESRFKESNYNCIEGWYVGRCGKADSTSYWRCGCDPDRPSLSYPILYKKSSCP